MRKAKQLNKNSLFKRKLLVPKHSPRMFALIRGIIQNVLVIVKILYICTMRCQTSSENLTICTIKKKKQKQKNVILEIG